jgi:hypothetical protein
MSKKPIAVVSNFNRYPIAILDYFEEYVLYDQSADIIIQHKVAQSYPNVKITENSGHSISHYLRYIIDNYDNLPQEVFFLKSNVIPRHIDKNHFESFILVPGLFPIFHDAKFVDKPGVAYSFYPGLFLEKNNSWYCSQTESSFFHSYDELFAFLFSFSKHNSYNIFAPGANYRVPSSKILNYPIFFWELLHYLVTYRFFPQEAYIVERMLFVIFLGGCVLDSKHTSLEQMIRNLPTLSSVDRESKMNKVKRLMKGDFGALKRFSH